MAEIFDLSAFGTSAEQFFTTLKRRGTDLVLDVRLRNSNQLCGFTKEKDLAYLVPEITGAAYRHDLVFAPSPELLGAYQRGSIGWDEYRRRYLEEMRGAGARDYFGATYGAFRRVCVLGTATPKRRSHSEALVGLLQGRP